MTTTTPTPTPSPTRRATRVPKTEITGLFGAVLKRMTRKQLGAVPEPAKVFWHHRKVLTDMGSFGRKVQKWDQLDANLKTFAHMAVAAQVGCSWCLDLNYFLAHDEGMDEVKASEVPRWRESAVFSSLERDVLAYAEAMTETPPQVTDELAARLLDQLGAPALIELTAVVGFANLSTRGNVAMGIESQEYSAVCALPLARPSARSSSSA